MTDPDGQTENLRAAYEGLARQVVAERLLFADRMQEEVDAAQRDAGDRDRHIAELTRGVVDARARVDSLHAELKEAHAELATIREKRLFRILSKLGIW